MTAGPQHVYFADLNCPFCYALDERIQELGLTHLAAWRGVQHLLTTQQWRVQTQEVLAEEVSRVGRLAPELTIRVPPRRPDTESGPARASARLSVVKVKPQGPQASLRQLSVTVALMH